MAAIVGTTQREKKKTKLFFPPSPRGLLAKSEHKFLSLFLFPFLFSAFFDLHFRGWQPVLSRERTKERQRESEASIWRGAKRRERERASSLFLSQRVSLNPFVARARKRGL